MMVKYHITIGAKQFWPWFSNQLASAIFQDLLKILIRIRQVLTIKCPVGKSRLPWISLTTPIGIHIDNLVRKIANFNLMVILRTKFDWKARLVEIMYFLSTIEVIGRKKNKKNSWTWGAVSPKILRKFQCFKKNCNWGIKPNKSGT